MSRLFFLLFILMLFQDQSQNKNIQGSICVKLIDVQNLFDGLSSKQMGKIDQSISNPNLYRLLS